VLSGCVVSDVSFTSVVQAMAVLNRDLFLAKRVSSKLEKVELPDGDLVYLRPASAKIYRDYQRSLRDKDGMPIQERRGFGDELVVANLMVDQNGQRMFSDDEVLAGVFNEIDMPFLTPVVRKAYELLGIAEPDEDREKNLSTTVPTEPS
jgi:hypothetical protein